jgi:predicted dehydrogenase
MAGTLRIGIVGLGHMGRIRAREIARHPAMVLVAGSDPDRATADDFHEIMYSLDYRDVIDAGVDVIFICTPNRYTPEVAVAALDAGKHVFCEKPPGRFVKDIEEIIAAEKRNPRCKLKFGFNHRYHAGIQEAKRIISTGRLGHILWLRGVYGKSGGNGFESSWRNTKEIGGGGILLDQGIHMLDLFRFFCGDFVEVKSMVTTAYWNVEVEDNAFALLRDEAGRIAMLHSSSTQWKHRFNLEIYLSEGYLSVNGILSSTRSYGEETITVARRQFDEGFALGKPREEIIYFDADPSWEMEVTDFADCIQHDLPVMVGTSEDALKAMQLVYAIYQADSAWWVHAQDSADQRREMVLPRAVQDEIALPDGQDVDGRLR